MNQSEPKFIGKRIKVIRSSQRIEAQISQRIERWQEALLLAWLQRGAADGARVLAPDGSVHAVLPGGAGDDELAARAADQVYASVDDLA
jgi:hypothetical protein